MKRDAVILSAIEAGARTVHELHDVTRIPNQRLLEHLSKMAKDGTIRKAGLAPSRAKTSVREVNVWEVAA